MDDSKVILAKGLPFFTSQITREASSEPLAKKRPLGEKDMQMMVDLCSLSKRQNGEYGVTDIAVKSEVRI